MATRNIFVSVGSPANDEQEAFIQAVENRLRGEGFVPNTVGRNSFSNDAPLRQVVGLLDNCDGAIVVALERTYFPAGLERRNGPKETRLAEVRLPTPWNHIEAAMAYSRRLPLMVIAESGLKDEGLLQHGYDWYVQRVTPGPAALTTHEFNSVLADWKSKVLAFEKSARAPDADARAKTPSELSAKEILGALKPGQIWSILVAIGSIASGAFALGAKFSGH